MGGNVHTQDSDLHTHRRPQLVCKHCFTHVAYSNGNTLLKCKYVYLKWSI